MVMLNEDTIEDFIRDNKSKFEVYRPPENHSDRFFFKLNYRIRHIINIVPYLIRVAVATVIIFISSIIVWNNFIRKDRNEISLGKKITHAVEKVGARPEKM
jgi:hypothetical protein